MAGSLILIGTKTGTVREVYKKLLDIEMVEEVEMVTGPHDIMVVMRAHTWQDIRKALIEKIRNIEGVEDTITYDFVEGIGPSPLA